MRRPASTPAQKQHAREQRTLLRLRRAAVRFVTALDMDDDVAGPLALADLQAACDAYAGSLGARERRRLSK